MRCVHFAVGLLASLAAVCPAFAQNSGAKPSTKESALEWTVIATRPEVAQRAAFNAGLTAFESGDYANAQTIWARLARSGHLVAASNLLVMANLNLPARASAIEKRLWKKQFDQSEAGLTFRACQIRNAAKLPEPERRAERARCERLAVQGDVIAPVLMVQLLLDAKSPDRDSVAAFEWALKAARAGWLAEAAVVALTLAGKPTKPFDKLSAEELRAVRQRVRVDDLPKGPWAKMAAVQPESGDTGDGKARRGGVRFTGSGIVVATQGRVLTNAHVVEQCGKITVAIAGEPRAARVLAIDAKVDLALISTEGALPRAALLRAPVSMRTGEEIVAVGFPLTGLLSAEPIVTTGIVSALAGIRGDPTQLQISAPVQPGNSGGPVFDMNGNVVGVVVAGIGTLKAARATGGVVPQNVNFAVNVAEAQKFLDRHKVAWGKRGFDTAKRLSVADIAEAARQTTAFIECPPKQEGSTNSQQPRRDR